MDKAKNVQVNKPKDKQTRKLPEIKQTLTSKYRMLKANPLLALEERNKKEPQTVDDLKKPWLYKCYVPSNFETNKVQQAGPSKPTASSRQFTSTTTGQLNRSNIDFSVNRRLESSTPLPQNSSRRDTIDFVAQNRKLVSNGCLRPGTGKAGEFKKPEIHGKPLAKARAPVAGGVPAKQQTSNLSRGDSNRNATGAVGKQFPIKSKAASVSGADRQRQHGNVKQDKGLKYSSNPTDAKKSAPSDKMSRPKKPALRRSLSAQHIEKKKSINSGTNNDSNAKKRNDSEQSFTRTNSLDRSLSRGVVAGSSKSPVENLKISMAYAPGVSPVTEEVAVATSSSGYRDTSLSFKTPGAFARRSIIVRTPNTESRRSNINNNSIGSSRSSSAHIQSRICSTPHNYGDLQKNLLEWLKKRGKSLSEYHHLKCFGLMHGSAAAEGGAAPQQQQQQQRENGLNFAIPKVSVLVNGKGMSEEEHRNVEEIDEKNNSALLPNIRTATDEDVTEDDLDDNDKENIETIIPDLDDSYENLHIIPPPAPAQDVFLVVNGNDDVVVQDDPAKNEQCCNGHSEASSNGLANSRTKISERVNLSGVAKEALVDLHKLILEGYPKDQCEIWLKLMHHQIARLDEEPQYWECRAAIEQARGNITSAVECYKTAIIQGAEVKSVDKSLDKLLQKFSLLNINAEDGTASGAGAAPAPSGSHKDRARILLDARNIFKSNIIQFAVRERKIKKTSNQHELQVEQKQKKVLVATPVRRSTRLSRSHYTSTPGVTVYSSLQEIDDSEYCEPAHSVEACRFCTHMKWRECEMCPFKAKRKLTYNRHE